MGAMLRGELARRSGCHFETIRYYERMGLLPSPPRNKGGYRRYGFEHLRRLRFIVHSRALGFPIEELRSLLDLIDRREVSCDKVKASAERHLSAIRERIDSMRKMEQVLEETLQRCSGDDVPECPLIDMLFQEDDVIGDDRSKR